MTTDRPFTDKLEAPDVPKMPDEYQALLKRVLRIQADCEIGGPHLYVNQWLLTAPSADDQWMLAKVAGEEIDHFRKINRLLNDLGEDASELMYVEKSRRDLEAFRQAMPTWADVAAFGFLIDRVGQYQLEEFVGCSYAPLDRALPRIIQEEKTHVGYGLVKLRDMVRTEEGKALAQAAVDRWYPRGLDMFGLANSRRAGRYLHWGLKRRSNETARAEYMAEVAPLIESLGLRVPDATSGRHFR
jgi:1,2-phenylacetyl-CoA epoxidase catalytic subunit